MALACALAWACAILLFRRVGAPGSGSAPVDTAAINLFKNAFATCLLILTLVATGDWFDTSRAPKDWALLAGSGILGLAIADTLFLSGLRRIDASVAAVADCAYAPTVVLLSFVFLREPMGLGIAIGAPLIVAGLVLVSWQRRAQAKGPRPIDRRGLLLAIAGVMGTGTGVVLAKPALGRSSLVEATAVRLVAGTIGLFLFQAIFGKARGALVIFRSKAHLKLVIPATFLGTYVAMILWLGGMKYGTASRAALLNQTGAIMVLVLSRLLGEKVPGLRWVGAGVAVAGVAAVLSL